MALRADDAAIECGLLGQCDGIPVFAMHLHIASCMYVYHFAEQNVLLSYEHERMTVHQPSTCTVLIL